MRKTIKIGTLALAVVGLLTQSTNALAINPYGIVYSGGQELGVNNVQIEPNLVEGLTPLIVSDNNLKVGVSDSSRWEVGYYSTNGICTSMKFFRIYDNGQVDPSSNLSYRLSRNQYTADIKFKNVFLDGVTGLSENGNSIIVGVYDKSGNLTAGNKLYSDPQCQNLISGVKQHERNNGQMYVEVELNMNENGKPFTSDKLYFGLIDFDAAQSFKILNQNNEIKPENMYALSATILQRSNPSEIAFKNMYVPNGKYLYSGYDIETGACFNSDNKSNVYIKINQEAQASGLDLVFGFGGVAGSGISYYAKQFNVKYFADTGGEITGINNEDIISGNSPNGSSQTPTQGYKLKYWIADKDITLSDGGAIKAGGSITEEQIKQVVVDKDLVFTAIYEEESDIKVPDTGSSIMEVNGAYLPVSVFGILLGASIIWVLPHINRKKVSFKRH